MSKKKVILLVGSIFLAIVAYQLVLFLDDESLEKENANKRNDAGKRSLDKSQKIEGSNSRYIEFSEYEGIYDEMEVENDPTFLNINNEPENDPYCEDVKKAALVEFIYLKRENGVLKPNPIQYVHMRKINEEACGNQITESLGDGKARHLALVTEDCSDCEAGPGTRYYIKKIEDTTDLHYPIQIPEKDKLSFQKHFDELKGTKSDKVYRIPILVKEALKTKKKKRQTRSTYTFHIKGIARSSEKNMETEIRYKKENTFLKKSKITGEDAAKLKVSAWSKRAALGGDLFIYHVPKKETFRAETQKIKKVMGSVKKKQMPPSKLIQLKHNINSFHVNLTKNSKIDYKGKRWIEETIVLDPVFNEFRERMEPDVVDQLRKVLLISKRKIDKKNGKNKVLFSISESWVFTENGTKKVTLNAPAGIYSLYVTGHYRVKKRLEWPPVNDHIIDQKIKIKPR